MDIFSQYAPKYWDAGLSVIPLLPRKKDAFLKNWQQWHDHLPPVEVQQQWLTQFTWNNIGLVLGRQSNIVMVDIDTLDPVIEKAVLDILPPSPWCRIGAKGMMLAYKYNGLPTYRIKNSNGDTLVEVLSTRTQCVLPPSIHPDSDKYRKERQEAGLGDLVYTANCNLYDVLDKLVELPQDFEDQLRAKLSTVTDMELKSSKFKYSDKIPIGGRDVKMVQHAGFAATMVLRGECGILRAMSDMRAWYEEKVEKSKTGDDIDIEKGLRQIIQYILRGVNEQGKILPSTWDDGLTEQQKKDWGLEFTDDQEEWKCEQLLDYIHKCFTEHGEDDPNRTAGIEWVLVKVSKSIHLTSMDIERILQALKNGTKISIPAFKRRLAELKRGPVQGLNHTEIADAAVKEFGKKGYDLRYYNQDFWTWEGTHWSVMSEQKIWSLIAREFGELPAASKASDHKGIMKIMAQIVPQHIKVIDTPGINFRNGFLTWELKLVKHNPDFGMTYTLSYNYDPAQAHQAYKFQQFLYDSWGHNTDFEDKKRALQEAIAVTLFGKGAAAQTALLLYGQANSGKSQLLTIIQKLVPPEAVSAVAPEDWSDKWELSSLDGKLLNVAGELDKNKPLPAKMFKMVIDGSVMTGQHKFKDPFTFNPKAAHWFGSNHLPKSIDATAGFNRRWLILHFDKVRESKKQIIDFGEKLAEEEMEAIVAWAVEIFPEWLNVGKYTIPASSRLLTDDMALSNSVILQWMRDRLVDNPGNQVKEDKLYNDFFVYCTRHGGGRVIQSKDFCIQLSEFLGEQGRKKTIQAYGEIHYLDIGLREHK